MTRFPMCLAALIFLPGVGLTQQGKPEGDLPMLQGTWTFRSSVVGGVPQRKEGIEDFCLTLTEDKFTFKAGDLVTSHGTFRIEQRDGVKTIDLTPTDRNRGSGARLGIYRLEEKTLTLSLSAPGGRRPEGFESKKDEQTQVIEFRRAK